MSMTPITPGQFNPDPAPEDLGDLEAAFQRVFETPPGDAPVVDLAAGESIVDSSTREEGDGGGVVSPDPAPNATDDAPTPITPVTPDGGPTDITLPGDAPAGEGFQIADGGAEVEPAPTPATPAPTPTPPAPEAFDVNALMSTYLGRPMTADEGRDLLALIEDVTTGRVVLTPAQMAQAQAAPQPATPAPQPPAPAAPTLDEWGMPVEPATPAALPPEVQAQLDEMRQWREQQEAYQQQQYAQWVGQEQAAGAEEFASAPPIPLSPEELIVLEQKAARSGIFALEMQRTNNPRLAWKTALEQTVYVDPTFRERIIEAQVAARAVDNTQVENRQRLAASVAAGGGTVPGAQPIPTGPADMGTAKEAATRDLASLFANGQPGG